MAAIPAVPVVFNDTGLTDAMVDHEKLQHVLFRVIKIFGEPGSVDPASIADIPYRNHPVIQSLAYEECELFTELLALGPDSIKYLCVPLYNIGGVPYPAAPLHGKWTRKIRTVVA